MIICGRYSMPMKGNGGSIMLATFCRSLILIFFHRHSMVKIMNKFMLIYKFGMDED